MTKLKRQTKDVIINRIVQLFFFIMAPDIYVTAFNGVKYLFTQFGNAAVIEFTPFVAVMITVLIYTFLFGRFFCGYACAFGFFGDVVYDASEAVQKKLRGKVWQIPAAVRNVLMKVKYVLLAAVLGLCFFGLYSKVAGYDPWEVFGSFRAMDFSLDGKITGFIVLIAVMVGMVLVRRFFCVFLCPMGAVFSLIPVLPLSQMGRNPEKCAGKCHQCEKACPTGYFMSDEKSGAEFLGRNTGSGECINCNKCVSACPVCNAGPKLMKLLDKKRDEGTTGKKAARGNAAYMILIKAAVLFAAVKLVIMYVQ